ncbi:MAG: acyl carrier protein [Kofleriaceae bacterium]
MDRATVDEARLAITSFIVDNFLFGNKAEAPAADASFLETGLVDSTGVLEIVSFIEERYGISVADDELTPQNLDSVANLAAFITRKQGG